MYEVRSAGADLAFDTEDDLTMTVRPATDGDFEDTRHAWFVYRPGAEPYVLFHRWTGDLFLYGHEELALEVTGSERFDLLTLDDFSEEADGAAVAARYDELAADLQCTPLVLEVYDS